MLGLLRKSLLSKANRVFRESRRISERFRNLMRSKSINSSLSKFKEKTPLISKAIPISVNLRAYQMAEKASSKKIIWWNSKSISCRRSSIIITSCSNRSVEITKSYNLKRQTMSEIRANLKGYFLSVLMRSKRISARELKIKILPHYIWQIPANLRPGKSHQ